MLNLESLKSQSEDIVLNTFRKLFADLVRKYPSERKSLLRDLLTVESRIAHEGLPFATKTMPKLGKAIDASLSGQPLIVPQEFKRSYGNRAIPAFLQALLRGCYRPDGSLDRIQPDVLADIRQVLYLAYKLELPFSKQQEIAVMQAFVDNEREISGEQLSSHDPIIRVASKLVEAVFSDFDPKDITPRHGPGAVATGERLEQKWTFARLYNKIHQKYPYYDYFVAGGARELVDRIKWYQNLERLEDGRAKVVLVPKDSRGPRLISCEPLEFQYIQQGLGRKIMSHLEQHPLTKGHVNFIDQTVNGKLALQSSRTGEYATLDLKDASDRVSLTLVRLLFPKHLYECLEATRTGSTLLPDGREVPLTKFAPMGSALCFPVEAVCFWALAVAAVSLAERTNTRLASQHVFVYGDDIICRTQNFHAVTEALESCLLTVNRSKSFHTGLFRESCGVDAYDGVNVTPVRLRTLWSGKPSDASAFASWVSYANSFASKGYELTSQYLKDRVEEVYGVVPYGTASSGYPSWTVRSSIHAAVMNYHRGFKFRWSEKFQRHEVKVKFLKVRKVASTLDSWNRLLRNLNSGTGDFPSLVVLPRRTQVKTGWMRS